MTAEQKVLLHRIQVCNFVLLETSEFLDTHPANQEAIAYFNKYNEMLKESTQEYAAKYGPLAKSDFTGTERWTWVDGPWPWEMED